MVMKHYSPTGRKNHDRPLKRLLDTWDRNGSTSGPAPRQIYDDDENIKECDKRNSLISSKLHMISIFSNNDRHRVPKTFTPLHCTTPNYILNLLIVGNYNVSLVGSGYRHTETLVKKFPV
jgi:hypothetical protein